MQLYGSLRAHFTLVIKPERLLWLAEQFGFFHLVFLEGQAATVQAFEGQFASFFRRVGAKFRETWLAQPARTETASIRETVSKRFMGASWRGGCWSMEKGYARARRGRNQRSQ